MPLQDLEDRIAKLQAFDFGAEMTTAIQANINKIPDYIREQLAEGLDASGRPSIATEGRDTYAPLTIKLKENAPDALGRVTNYVTNYMTGELYRTLEAKLDGDVFEVDSPVTYFNERKSESSEQEFELNDENALNFAETYTLTAVEESLQAKTGLTILRNQG